MTNFQKMNVIFKVEWIAQVMEKGRIIPPFHFLKTILTENNRICLGTRGGIVLKICSFRVDWVKIWIKIVKKMWWNGLENGHYFKIMHFLKNLQYFFFLKLHIFLIYTLISTQKIIYSFKNLTTQNSTLFLLPKNISYLKSHPF